MAPEIKRKEDSQIGRTNFGVLNLLYFCFLGAQSCVFTLLPIFLKSNGMTESEVGIILALRPFISFCASPIMSGIADRFNLHRKILLTSICFAAIVRYLFLEMPQFHMMIFWVSLSSALDSPIGPIIDTFTMKQLDDVTKWGYIRLYGAMGFGSVSFVCGVVVSETSLGWNGMFILYWVLMAATFILSKYIFNDNPYDRVPVEKDEDLKMGKEKVTTENGNSRTNDGIQMGIECSEVDESFSTDHKIAPFLSVETHSGVPDDQNKSIFQQISHICLARKNILFFSILLTAGFAQGVIESFLYIHLENLGGTELLMGASRAVTGVAAMFCFRYASVMIRLAGEYGMLGFGLFIFIVRFLFFASLRYLPLWTVVPAELLHGFTYASLWAASTSIGFQIAPTHLKTTIQGVLSGLHGGVGFGSGALIGGYLFETLGAEKLFFFGAALVGTTLFCYLTDKLLGWVRSLPTATVMDKARD